MKSKRITLSVVLATKNEEENIRDCLKSVKDIADEIIVFDEESKDKTREIARIVGAEVFTVKHEPIFHKTKQKAIDKARGDWILQLDADERVTRELADEILKVINLSKEQIEKRRPEEKKKWKLFKRHQMLIENRTDTKKQISNEYVAFYVPRVNYFLGKPLKHAGVYPDGVIRLFKKGKAYLPSKSVHELMEIKGKTAWLFNDLEHHDSPNLKRYLNRANRYTDLTAEQYRKDGVSLTYFNLFKYSFILPSINFIKLYFRHKGFQEGMSGFIWSLFSSFHFPIAYFKYYTDEKNKPFSGKLTV